MKSYSTHVMNILTENYSGSFYKFEFRDRDRDRDRDHDRDRDRDHDRDRDRDHDRKSEKLNKFGHEIIRLKE